MAEGDIQREAMDFDVVIVGAGPAGLSAAIRLKQLCQEAGEDYSVAVIEKGAEVGAHILSGVVFDPIGLDQLFPDWREDPAPPFDTEVTEDRYLYLGPDGALRFPNFMFPPFMSNHGCYVGSLANLCRWLGEKAEAMGVEVYPGFPGADLEYGPNGEVAGVITGDFGVGRDGEPKEGHQPGMALRGKYHLIAEGVRGSLAKKLIARFELDKGRSPQKYGIGLKELWKVRPEVFEPGLVQHSFGWPLKNNTGGGSFLYHFGDHFVSIGYVVHLNYKNPFLSPYDEFQRFKHHETARPFLEGGERIAYGARAITEGGFQSVPKLAFPGGALMGCSAGFVNLPRIKGSNNAMVSGVFTAEAIFEALKAGRSHDEVKEVDFNYRRSSVYKDLKKVRNVKPLLTAWGTTPGLFLGGFDMWTNQLLGGLSLFGTMAHKKTDAASTEPASKHKPIDYPKPDGVISFDKLSSVFISNTNHEEDQPVHLTLKDAKVPVQQDWAVYGGPSTRYCPAGVYEFLRADGEKAVPGEDGAGAVRFQINAQNCVHCKTCDIKDPAQNIVWTTPEGGGGPVYPNM